MTAGELIAVIIIFILAGVLLVISDLMSLRCLAAAELDFRGS